MKALSERVLGKLHFTLEQVQDLTPTPMTLSSVMFYTGMNPYTRKPLFVARTQDEKRAQKSYFFRERPAFTAPQKRTAARPAAKAGASKPQPAGAMHKTADRPTKKGRK